MSVGGMWIKEVRCGRKQWKSMRLIDSLSNYLIKLWLIVLDRNNGMMQYPCLRELERAQEAYERAKKEIAENDQARGKRKAELARLVDKKKKLLEDIKKETKKVEFSVNIGRRLPLYLLGIIYSKFNSLVIFVVTNEAMHFFHCCYSYNKPDKFILPFLMFSVLPIIILAHGIFAWGWVHTASFFICRQGKEVLRDR